MWSYQQCMDSINQIIRELNSMYKLIIDLLTNDTLLQTATSSVPNLIEVIKGTALTLCVMFFLISFISKSLNLQWVTWENVMLLIIKCLLAKLCVENAEFITTLIYKGFNSFVNTVGDLTQSGFIVIDDNSIPSFGGGIEDPSGDDSWWGQVINQALSGKWQELIQNSDAKEVAAAQYFVSYSDAVLCSAGYDAGFLNFSPIILNIFIFVEGLIMKIIMIIANVIIISRLFELTVYTLVAPIPLSTLVCDGLSDIGKGFLKSYAAVTLQSLIIAIMFIAYSAVNNALLNFASQSGAMDGWFGLITSITLGIGVMSSSAWAKRICGAM